MPALPSPTPPVRRLRAVSLALALPVLALVLFGRALPARAATVVGGGSPADCTYSALVTALGAGGLIQFNCGPAPVSIPITDGVGLVPLSGTTIDGGDWITLSAAHFN